MPDPDTFTLTIELGNDAMQTPVDVAGVLQLVSEVITASEQAQWVVTDGWITDINGNKVGEWKVT